MKNFKVIIILLTSIQSFGMAKLTESECSQIDIRENMSPGMRKHFSSPRDQDSIGWCYGFTASDLISAEVGVPISSAHVSAIYNKSVDNSTFMKLGYNIGNLIINDKFEDVYEGGYASMAIRKSSNGQELCRESEFPFDKNNYGDTQSLILRLESIREHIKSSDSKSKKLICSEVEAINTDYNLSIDATKLQLALEKESLNALLEKIIDDHCKNKVKIPKFSVRTMKKPKRLSGRQHERHEHARDIKKYFKKIGAQLAKGKPVGVSYGANQIASSGTNHSSVLIGRAWSDGQCLFEIRNSWGKGCEAYDRDKIELCNSFKGSFWVSDEKFYKMVYEVQYIDN
ncbi:hypothetical protein M902_3034 [Bacteriovorax sp. BAL6_X]|uniref:hypothetical protein n=1 Tax=Bacteriovorax sp. BAL6_X TaxID=1201290 RepID=UPI000386DA2C|nr:hypothetical protein [Bacteriovorax sp. BAL6_X]EPZ51474.1 hypothetical protein M902_3034 [Bacteriovorax sp. BAL6_X]